MPPKLRSTAFRSGRNYTLVFDKDTGVWHTFLFILFFKGIFFDPPTHVTLKMIYSIGVLSNIVKEGKVLIVP